mmetsp:Transcript_3552/g.6045  ORF Transcript_3552/g.6045 Transcript_3552/m.6045 type:complete len:227 (-) Transcript_3552:384-1064(-)
MIMRLKTECGDQFITKVEGMLKDLSVSEEFMKKYLLAYGGTLTKKHGAIDLSVHVLSSNSWPISQDVSCSIPKQIGLMQDDFERYYKEVNKGKCIKYCIQMCTAVVEAKFGPKNSKLLDISGTQALVLLAFNEVASKKAVEEAEIASKEKEVEEKEEPERPEQLENARRSLSIEQLMEMTGLKEEALKEAIVSLSTFQYPILQNLNDSTPLRLGASKADVQPQKEG